MEELKTMNMIYILIGIVAQAFGWLHDYGYSRLFIYYRAGEGHSWFTDKYGFMSRTKPLIGAAIEYAFGTACALLAVYSGYGDQWGLAFMAPMVGAGLAHFIQAKVKLTKRLKGDRLVQIRTRRSWQGMILGMDRQQAVQKLANIGLSSLKWRGGRYWYKSVQFIYVDAPSPDKARPHLAEMLYSWLQLPDPSPGDSESERKEKLKAIWRDIKFHPEGDFKPVPMTEVK